MIFYHGTSKENYTAIKQEGFLYGRRYITDNNGKPIKEVDRCTYLATDLEEAKCYGEVVLQVEYNPFLSKHNNYKDGCWQVRVYEPIPIEQIIVISMSKRAEEAALKAYPNDCFVGVEYADMCRSFYQEGYEQAEKDLGWHSVKETLPPIDEEVIVLTDNIHGKIIPGAHGICFGHRPNPDGWDGKNMKTREVKHYDVVTYDGWNIPGVTHWMHCPKFEEDNK